MTFANKLTAVVFGLAAAFSIEAVDINTDQGLLGKDLYAQEQGGGQDPSEADAWTIINRIKRDEALTLDEYVKAEKTIEEIKKSNAQANEILHLMAQKNQAEIEKLSNIAKEDQNKILEEEQEVCRVLYDLLGITDEDRKALQDAFPGDEEAQIKAATELVEERISEITEHLKTATDMPEEERNGILSTLSEYKGVMISGLAIGVVALAANGYIGARPQALYTKAAEAASALPGVHRLKTFATNAASKVGGVVKSLAPAAITNWFGSKKSTSNVTQPMTEKHELRIDPSARLDHALRQPSDAF